MERNSRLFEESFCTTDRLILNVKEQAWRWVINELVVKQVKLEDIVFNWDKVMNI